MGKLTPMMQQYMEIKAQYQDAILFFRLGDFYEMFFEDALVASRELEITLTGRDCGQEERAPMCGVPYHSVDSYIDRLVLKGYKVALCEQVEDPSLAAGIVRRDVVRVITPGTTMDTQRLEEKRNNYLMSVYGNGTGWGLSYGDLTTGELFATEIIGGQSLQKLLDEVSRVQPREIIYGFETQGEGEERIIASFKSNFDLVVNQYSLWAYGEDYAQKTLKDHFKVLGLDGLGFPQKHLGINATGALIDYLSATQKRSLGHMTQLKVYHLSETMILDLTTRSNLELTETIRGRSKKGSLLWVLDQTQTAMGGRLLRKWIEAPLLNPDEINARLDGVEILKEDLVLREDLKARLREIYDIERLTAKIAFGSANPRDLVALKNSLQQIPHIQQQLQGTPGLIGTLTHRLDPLEDIADLIERAIVPDPPLTLKEGGIIRSGYHPEVDELHEAATNGKNWIANLEAEERERTGIKNLKVGFNKVFGYYIEVTKSYLKLVPTDYHRKQTLANCERYITPALKEMESKVLGAEERVIALEQQLFNEIRDTISKEVKRLQTTANAVASLDCLCSLAQVAAANQYSKPVINRGKAIIIKEGRHPVVEKMLDHESFITNDTVLEQPNEQIAIITGPNMAGKSTYMRQVAIIVLMAQIGSFIPAQGGTIGIVDRIFTRVGASDDLSQGQSTFMVEMSEMANILNSATENSLLILDEIGRGTSTFDGLSIAWSVVEHISKVVGAKTLFSTHYHELTELEGKIPGVKNYRISVKEDGENIIFLRKVVEGSADKSYGIQVAQLAGLPGVVIQRAKEILNQLEAYDIAKGSNLNAQQEVAATLTPTPIPGCTEVPKEVISPVQERVEAPVQLDFNTLYQQQLIEELRSIDLLTTTPIEALNLLAQLQKKLKQLP